MPYCIITPSLKRSSVALTTLLCCSDRVSDIRFNRIDQTITFNDTLKGGINTFKVTVSLSRVVTDISVESSSYSVGLTLERVASTQLSVSDDSKNKESTIIDASTSLEHVSGPVNLLGNSSIIASTTGSTSVPCHFKNNSEYLRSVSGGYCGLSDIAIQRDTKSLGGRSICTNSSTVSNTLVTLEVKDTIPDTSGRSLSLLNNSNSLGNIICPTADHYFTCLLDHIVIPVRDFVILSPYLYSVSAHIGREGVILLSFNLRVRLGNVSLFDLGLASLYKSGSQLRVSTHSSLSVHCKGCGRFVHKVADAKLVPLPTDIFNSSSDATFCEECELDIPSDTISLCHSPSIVYHSEEFVTLFIPPASDPLPVRCNTCDLQLGHYRVGKLEYVDFYKSHISLYSGDSDKDIFWRHSPLSDFIESLQYNSQSRLYITSEGNDKTLFTGCELEVPLVCLEIIKICSTPDTFVTSAFGILKASRILWRFVREFGNPLIKCNPVTFELLHERLLYFSQELDPNSGYRPSLLVSY
ncbi:uncharacterized protein BBOV_IV001870 [Babesia bovis T2Bo]|uniref:Uncharacterized protein n=1 Tax=Babesia bovis TaxID=5865 RepID=A7AVF8_BABBO|nr:uncharacterized protein BBOV_IV001870 [Babesia bovis T2Bo]EDO05784.1 hypothetical protein BBOV_IV001870 [Babesia bovis T2Bo]|eukprot:XP_001609352.1 hypothetical protein [Babesia bovis T2Bo]